MIKIQLRLLALAWLALSSIISVSVAAESDIFYDKRIPRQEFGVAPTQAERNSMMQVMTALPMRCGVEETTDTHAAHEQAFKIALNGYQGNMPADQVIGHILMTDRGISEAQMVSMISMLGDMRTHGAIAVLRNLKRWSGVLSARFVSKNVPEQQRQLVSNGVERSLRDSLAATATRNGLRL